MNFLINAVAETEFKEAVSYYNRELPGLGFEFALEISNTIERIRKNPEAWTKLSKRSRRCMANRFPYGIIYQIRKDHILIISIMHLHRHPDSWKQRDQHV